MAIESHSQSFLFYVPVNSYGHVETVSEPNHTYSWASLTKRLTNTSCRGDYCDIIDIAGSTIVILLLLWTAIAILLSETFMLVWRRNLRIWLDFSACTSTNFCTETRENFRIL